MTIIPDVCACGQSSCSDPLAAGKWMQLPIAPVANHRILFDGDFKKYKALYPQGVIGWLEEEDKKKQIRGVQISGPGDPMATPQVLIDTLDLLEKSKLSLTVEIKCLGLGTEKMAGILAVKNVNQVNMEVLAVDASTVGKLYAWVRPGKKNIPLADIAETLINEQKQGVRALSKAGIKVNILTTVYPGINDNVIEDICKEMALAGASSITLVPFSKPEQSEAEMDFATEIEKIPALPDCDNNDMGKLKELAKQHLEVTELTKNTFSPRGNGCGCDSKDDSTGSFALARPTRKRANVAVASGSGLDIDLHLGQAEQFLIYGPRDDDGLPCLLGTRAVNKAVQGSSSRWNHLAEECLQDCFALLVAAAGDKPKAALAECGISVLQGEGNIDAVVDRLYGGGKKKKC